MKAKTKIDYTLYLVTDRDLLRKLSLTEAVEQAILGGVTLVQLREKQLGTLDFYRIACEVKQVTERYGIPIINDRLDIALAVDAAGLHIGQSDLPAAVARRLLGEAKILGVSAATLDEALKAVADGADYIGVGAIFRTDTKKDANDVSIARLQEIKQQTNIPVVAIGGISENNIGLLQDTGIDGIAVVSAILGKEAIKQETENLKKQLTFIKVN